MSCSISLREAFLNPDGSIKPPRTMDSYEAAVKSDIDALVHSYYKWQAKEIVSLAYKPGDVDESTREMSSCRCACCHRAQYSIESMRAAEQELRDLDHQCVWFDNECPLRMNNSCCNLLFRAWLVIDPDDRQRKSTAARRIKEFIGNVIRAKIDTIDFNNTVPENKPNG